MENTLEFYSIEFAKDYMRQIGKTKKRFYYNVFGWNTYLTLKPTFATPTGKHKDFKRSIIITL